MTIDLPLDSTVNFRVLFESAPGLYLVLAPDLKIVAVSDSYLRATMTKRGDILGKGIFEVFPDNPDDPTATGVSNLRSSLARVLELKTADKMAFQKYDIRRPQEEGGGFEERYWNPINTPILGSQNEIIYIIHQVEDVTELVNRTAERDQSNSKVTGLEREKFLREQFVSLLSHDLRTPLTAAMSSAQLISRMPNRPDQHPKLIGRILDSISRADQMITNLLDARRIDAGEPLALQFTEVGLVSLVNDTMAELSTIHGDRFTLVSDEVINGYWSADGLRRIIENLLTNAVKYGSATTPITVRVDKIGSKVQIGVHNFGSFLSEEDQIGIFDQFKRGNLSAGTGLKGWGLGLTLVKGLTKAHGGNVTVKSHANEGTTFFVELPRDSRPYKGSVDLQGG